MSELRIYDESANLQSVTSDFSEIQSRLRTAGIDFERWEASQQLDDQATQDEVIEAYREQVDRLMAVHGFKSVDVINMHAEHPQRETMRAKFLSEHSHAEHEVRFFVDGQALFNIREGGQIFSVLCSRGDLISVPANMRHWFDMGPAPFFKAIRLFTTPEGWVAVYTGSAIADGFPRLEAPHYWPRAA